MHIQNRVEMNFILYDPLKNIEFIVRIVFLTFSKAINLPFPPRPLQCSGGSQESQPEFEY